ncbi:hypothetical protein FPZ11_05865 [Humibacter ginsenosidimutans]|uniref:Uncharacterized protein n=1 Tax=Humibacter ginsenosidimutans TaxID=2599293 RepID=A0A5B8M2K1_9MICO|nr:hypothetical protein FPZ11_05865 [Humibacter ginsenosidimutans]
MTYEPTITAAAASTPSSQAGPATTRCPACRSSRCIRSAVGPSPSITTSAGSDCGVGGSSASATEASNAVASAVHWAGVPDASTSSASVGAPVRSAASMRSMDAVGSGKTHTTRSTPSCSVC